MLFILWIGVGIAALFLVDKEPAPAVPPPSTFWPGKTLVSETGYLLTENHLPLRALARKPNVKLFLDKNGDDAGSVVGVMRPWTPYLVYEFFPDTGRMQIGIADSSQRYWVAYDECFCWTTRECVSLEQPVEVFSSLENAKAGSRLEGDYVYRYADHFRPASSSEGNPDLFESMAALPLVERADAVYWCLLRPEGDASGYQKVWIKVSDASTGAVFRIRTGRLEFARYLQDLYRLVNEFKNRANQHATADLTELFVSFLSFDQSSNSKGAGRTQVRLNGILKPTGGVQGLLRDEVEYGAMRTRLLSLMEFDANSANWDKNDVAYPEMDKLP